jgi:molecular chaperone DnaK
VNPDEVVAVGAAIQAGVLSGDVKDMVLLDVTPLSLGIETMGGVMTVMIRRNTTLPTGKKETFTTGSDGQSSVEVHVLQGERTESKSNRTLGKFSLDGIMPAPRGTPKVEVSFDIDANGILSVHAKDLATGKDQAITITASSGLTEADIQKMVAEAADHEAEDKTRREEIERRNKLENLCYSVEKTLGESKDKLAAADVTSLEALLHEARGAVERQDDASIVSLSERLEKEAHRVAAAMYQSAGATQADPGAPPPAAGQSKPRGNVVDAEFEDSQQQGHP